MDAVRSDSNYYKNCQQAKQGGRERYTNVIRSYKRSLKKEEIDYSFNFESTSNYSNRLQNVYKSPKLKLHISRCLHRTN